MRAPSRPLSASALYDVVASHLPTTDRPRKGRGPHGLRHACARHLIEAGLSFKEVGDHLGHRSPDSTRIYAKVHLAALRLVAFEDQRLSRLGPSVVLATEALCKALAAAGGARRYGAGRAGVSRESY